MYISATMDIDTTLTHEVKSDLEVITAGYAVVEEGDAGANRPSGWPDYQLLYIKNGMGHFLIDREEIVLSAGTAIIFHPYEPQVTNRVTVVSGQTSTVNFNNTLKRGSLSVSKTAEDGFIEHKTFHLYGTSLSGLKVDEYAVTDERGIDAVMIYVSY